MDKWYFVFDTETTGTNTKYDEVIELAGIKFCIKDERLVVNSIKFIDQYFNIDREVPADARRVNGLTRSMLIKYSNGLYLEDCIDTLSEYLYDDKCIAVNYNTKFDVSILNSNLRRAGAEPIKFEKYTDVMQFCKNPYTGRPIKLVLAKTKYLPDNESVDALYTQLFNRKASDHSALYDAYITFRLFLALELYK